MGAAGILVGVISDTHGLLRPQALDALRGSDLIIHAGDVGRSELLEPLRALAPTYAVRGNVDRAALGADILETQLVEVGTLQFFVLHDIAALHIDPAEAGFAAVVSGHWHRPSIETRAGVLYLNPGSAGPRRFDLPVSLARVRVTGQEMQPELIRLDVP